MRKNTRLIAIVLVVVIGGGGAVFWHKVGRYSFFARNFDTVVEGEIYRSGRFKPRVLASFQDKYGIKTVIDFGAWHEGSPEEAAEQAMADELGITRHVLRLSGAGTGDPNSYVDALRLMMKPGNRPLLVHCAAGAQRAGGIVILYRHLEEGVSIDDAFAEAARHGHDPARNTELFPFITENLDVIAEAYRSDKPIVQDELGNWIIPGNP